MPEKTKNIINLVLAGLVGFIFIGSSMSKFMANDEAIIMAQAMGIDASSYKIIAVVELISILLFIYPRTGIVGTLLLVAYMGGAIATHLEHGQSIIAPCAIAAFVWIVAVVRFPELKQRLFGN